MNDPHFRPLPPDPDPDPVPTATTLEQPATVYVTESPPIIPSLRVYSHSTLVYWWPVWVVGYVMAGLSRWRGG